MKDSQKVYISGVEGRGEKIIKMLTELGAVNHWNYIGDRITGVYYIRHDGYIGVVGKDEELAQIIMDNYRELHLPENWKDGDILFSETDNEFAVFKGGYKISSVNADKFFCHIATCFKGYLTYQAIYRKDFRLATKSEVAQFHERLHAIEKDWDAEKKQLVDWKWKPKCGEVYWVIRPDGDVETYTCYDDPGDKYCFNFGNYFKTKNKAEAMAKKVRKLLLGGEE